MLSQEDSTGSVDQTQLDSASESEKKWANHKQFPSVFVSRAVQKGHASWLWLVVFDPNFFYSWETFTHDANLHRCKFSQFALTFRSIR